MRKNANTQLVEIQPLIPSVKMLQSAGITFNVITTYIVACTEKSVLQNMDMKTAAFEVVQVIRKYHDLERVAGQLSFPFFRSYYLSFFVRSITTPLLRHNLECTRDTRDSQDYYQCLLHADIRY